MEHRVPSRTTTRIGHGPLRLAPALPWLCLGWLAAAGGGSPGAAAARRGGVGEPVAVLAVRTPAGDAALAGAVRAGRFFRRAVQRLSGMRVEVGEAAAGDVEVLVDVAPAAMAASRAAGLPLRFAGGAVELAGTRYAAPTQAVAVRQPAAARPTWLVVGVTVAGAAALADRLLFEVAAAAGGFGRSAAAGGSGRPAAPEFDYLVREAPRLERRGRWLKEAGGAYGVDAAGERDDLREWRRSAAGLRQLSGGRVTLLVPEAVLAGGGRGEMARLVAQLDLAVAEMAPRVPLPAPVVAQGPRTGAAPAIVVAVEEDFVAQARHTGEIGEVVPAAAPDDRAELHLVYHPDDLPAYRLALAGRLMARAGLTGPAGDEDASVARARVRAGAPRGGDGADTPRGGGGEAGAPRAAGEGASMARAGAAAADRPAAALAPWLERGAALWLAGGWYGRPYRDWLPWLADAAMLPSAAELLAPGPRPEGPVALWTPVAAALLDDQPGGTLAAKLGAARRLTPLQVEAWLLRLASRQPATGGSSKPDAPTPGAKGGDRLPLPFLRGVSLAMENSLEGGYHAPALDLQLARLAGLGVDAVSLMPFAYQEGPGVPRLALLNGSPESETDVGLIHAVRRAHAHGLRVLYKPHVWVGGGSWPGDVAMHDEAGWQAWWRDYRRYVLHHAVIARWAGADLFSVGCELSQTLGRGADWRRLIAAVRQVFPGRLTYAGNWSGDLERAPFWEQLDVIGVDAYFPLSPDPAAGRAALASGAAGVVARLAAASRRWQRPLLLTEVGFAACRAAWTAPHREGGTPSPADQAAAYAALLGALGHPSWLAGTFVWKAFSGELPGRAAGRRWSEDDAADFRFLGRPAESVIAAYYAAAPRGRAAGAAAPHAGAGGPAAPGSPPAGAVRPPGR